MWRGRIGHTEGSPYYHLFLCQESFLLSFNTNYRKYCVRFYFPTSNSAFENRRYFPPHDIWPLRISTGLSVSIADQKKSSFQVFDKPSIITGDTEEEFGRVSILVVFSFFLFWPLAGQTLDGVSQELAKYCQDGCFEHQKTTGVDFGL